MASAIELKVKHRFVETILVSIMYLIVPYAYRLSRCMFKEEKGKRQEGEGENEGREKVGWCFFS